MSESRAEPDYEPQPLPHRFDYPLSEMQSKADAYYHHIPQRHSVRQFSDKPVDAALMQRCIQAAGTAPSGANHQPWHFVCVQDADLKHRIRLAAEAEEVAFYGGKAGERWLAHLEKIGTDAHKPYLEIAPWLIAIFSQPASPDEQGQARKNYYVKESVGIACGLFIASLHRMGLSTLTHTPSPMGFLSELTGRPANEKPYILFPVGYAADDAIVPDLERKALDQVSVFHE